MTFGQGRANLGPVTSGGQLILWPAATLGRRHFWPPPPTPPPSAFVRGRPGRHFRPGRASPGAGPSKHNRRPLFAHHQIRAHDKLGRLVYQDALDASRGRQTNCPNPVARQALGPRLAPPAGQGPAPLILIC